MELFSFRKEWMATRNIDGIRATTETGIAMTPPLSDLSRDGINHSRPKTVHGKAVARLVTLGLSLLIVLISNPSQVFATPYGNFNVGGRIEEEYLARGGPNVVGLPTSAELNDGRGGKFQVFANASSIYWSPSLAVNNAYATLVRGSIRDTWAKYGWETGSLGYPKNSEQNLTKNNGRYNHFENGSVYWTQATGAHPVWGAIRDQWAAGGWENSPYGYPTSDEYQLNGGFQQAFEGGLISYNVGAEPDDDPNGTDALIGADDPYNKFAGRFVQTHADSGAVCTADDAVGQSMCIKFGNNTTFPVDPTVAAISPEDSQRTSPSPSESSATPEAASPPQISPTPVPNSSPIAPVPSAAVPCSSTPATTSTPTPTSSAPVTTAPEADCGAPTSVEEVVPESPFPKEPSATVPSTAVPQGRVFPAHQQPTDPNEPTSYPEPAEPARDNTAENAFFVGGQQIIGNWCTTTPAKMVGKRFYACSTIRYTIQYRVKYNGRTYTNGWEKGFAYRDVRTNFGATSTTKSFNQVVRERAKFVRKIAIGRAGAARVTLTSTVEGTAGRTGGLSPSAPQTGVLATNPQIDLTMTMGLAARSNKIERDTTLSTMTITDPTVAGVTSSAEFRFAATRCDSMMYVYADYPGCIIAPDGGQHNYPVLDMTTSKVWSPQAYDHVLTAQQSLLPGSPVGVQNNFGAMARLQRIPYNSTQRGRNNGTACPNPLPSGYNRPSPAADWQCDEYPFAATEQGAALYPTFGRTRDWCSIADPPLPWNRLDSRGWSACFIPAEQNGSTGRLLPAFHRENRILYKSDDAADGYLVSPHHT